LHTVWVFVTDCGDSAVTAPLALLVLIFLIVSGQRRVAFAWILAVGGAAIVIGALKLAFGACGATIAGNHIVSPSGHTAMSTAVYGALALLAGSRLPERRRYAVYAATGAVIVGIALSRVVLHEHNFPEIVVGWVVGAGAVAVFAVALGRQQAPPLPLGWMVLCGAILVALLHGTRWHVEPAVRHLAWLFRLALPICR
jgi:membrane-associated phospholipid phosphatase